MQKVFNIKSEAGNLSFLIQTLLFSIKEAFSLSEFSTPGKKAQKNRTSHSPVFLRRYKLLKGYQVQPYAERMQFRCGSFTEEW
jgi:hypothetical protein